MLLGRVRTAIAAVLDAPSPAFIGSSTLFLRRSKMTTSFGRLNNRGRGNSPWLATRMVVRQMRVSACDPRACIAYARCAFGHGCGFVVKGLLAAEAAAGVPMSRAKSGSSWVSIVIIALSSSAGARLLVEAAYGGLKNRSRPPMVRLLAYLALA